MAALRTDLEFLNRGHSTRWGNLGCWDEGESYPSACAQLARRLGQAAGLGAGDAVLDVGAGAGDQLALWVEQFGVASVAGLDLDLANVQRGRRLLLAQGLEGRVRFERASATNLPPGGPFDVVLALDCAYHFRPRARFLRQAAERCAPGARLALTDFVLGEQAPRRPLRASARWAEIPGENLLGEAAYRDELERCGWHVRSLERLDEPVLDGFARHALRRLPRAALRQLLGGWPKLVGTGLALRLLSGRDWVHYVLVVGERA